MESVNNDFMVFAQQVLAAHNTYRMRHGSPPLSLDEELNKECQECAKDLLDATNIDYTHFPDRGQNVCMMTITDPEYTPSGDLPVKEWYRQRFEVDITKEPEDNKSVNFTQVVWKSTQLLGVGVARSETKIVIVCHYMPQGNIYGECLENVLPEVDKACATN